MDSTRAGSVGRSPWSEQSDWASSCGVTPGATPRLGGRSSSAGTEITTRTHSPMPAFPLGKAFEEAWQKYMPPCMLLQTVGRALVISRNHVSL